MKIVLDYGAINVRMPHVSSNLDGRAITYIIKHFDILQRITENTTRIMVQLRKRHMIINPYWEKA